MSLTKRTIKGMGCIPDLADIRDFRYAVPSTLRRALPPAVDLRGQMPPVYDQLSLGACTGNAIAAAVQFERAKQELAPDFIPSRLFVYYCERVIERTVDEDAGAMIRDGIKAVNKIGVCPEDMYPYDIARFAERPGDDDYAEALKCRAVSYLRVRQTLNDMKGCLAEGYPFVVGFSVYSSFMDDDVARTGIGQMPKRREHMEGGHAVLAVGYSDDEQRFVLRNSWGMWGQEGYFTLPYKYLTNSDLSSDFWTIRGISAGAA